MDDGVRHDHFDSLSEVGTGYAQSADERRPQVELANCENSLSICLRIASPAQNLFITSTLPFFHQSLSNPPDNRVEPKDGFHNQVDGAGEIVSPVRMAEFVCKYRVKLRGREAGCDAF